MAKPAQISQNITASSNENTSSDENQQKMLKNDFKINHSEAMLKKLYDNVQTFIVKKRAVDEDIAKLVEKNIDQSVQDSHIKSINRVRFNALAWLPNADDCPLMTTDYNEFRNIVASDYATSDVRLITDVYRRQVSILVRVNELIGDNSDALAFALSKVMEVDAEGEFRSDIYERSTQTNFMSSLFSSGIIGSIASMFSLPPMVTVALKGGDAKTDVFALASKVIHFMTGEEGGYSEAMNNFFSSNGIDASQGRGMATGLVVQQGPYQDKLPFLYSYLEPQCMSIGARFLSQNIVGLFSLVKKVSITPAPHDKDQKKHNNSSGKTVSRYSHSGKP